MWVQAIVQRCKTTSFYCSSQGSQIYISVVTKQINFHAYVCRVWIQETVPLNHKFYHIIRLNRLNISRWSEPNQLDHVLYLFWFHVSIVNGVGDHIRPALLSCHAIINYNLTDGENNDNR